MSQSVQCEQASACTPAFGMSIMGNHCLALAPAQGCQPLNVRLQPVELDLTCITLFYWPRNLCSKGDLRQSHPCRLRIALPFTADYCTLSHQRADGVIQALPTALAGKRLVIRMVEPYHQPYQ